MAKAILIGKFNNTSLTHYAAESDITLITFDHAGAKYKEGFYWGKRFIEKHNYNCYAFTHTERHWYPASEVIQLAKLIKKDRPVLIYGGSMGAYAAIKHSNLLSADHVLAFSPQFSINPLDLDNKDLRFIRDFDSCLHSDMSIKKEDVAGNVTVFYDPMLQVDALNVSKISNVARVNEIRVPYLGHTTSHLLLEKSFNSNFIEYVLNYNYSELRRSALHARKNMALYRGILAKKVYKTGNKYLALNIAESITKNSWENLNCTSVVAHASFDLKKWKLCEKACWHLVRLSPSKEKYWDLLGRSLSAQGKDKLSLAVKTAANSLRGQVVSLAVYIFPGLFCFI